MGGWRRAANMAPPVVCELHRFCYRQQQQQQRRQEDPFHQLFLSFSIILLLSSLRLPSATHTANTGGNVVAVAAAASAAMPYAPSSTSSTFAQSEMTAHARANAFLRPYLLAVAYCIQRGSHRFPYAFLPP